MALTKLQQNQIEPAGTRLYLPPLRSNMGHYGYIKILAPNIKGNNNTDYFISFRGTDRSISTLLDIAGVVMLQMDGSLKSWNFSEEPWPSDEILGADYLSQHEIEKIELWCNVNGTTRTWKYRLEGAAEWTSGPVITDTGINPASTDGNFIGNNRFMDNGSLLYIGWDFRVVQDGTTVFDARTAVRGRDFEVEASGDPRMLELKELL